MTEPGPRQMPAAQPGSTLRTAGELLLRACDAYEDSDNGVTAHGHDVWVCEEWYREARQIASALGAARKKACNRP